MGQTPIPVEPPGTPGTVVFVGDVGVSIRLESDTVPRGCNPTEVVTLLTAFFTAFSNGDQLLLQRFFPSEDDQNRQGTFQWYGVGGRPGSFNPGFVAFSHNREDLMAYFVERHEHEERLQLLHIDYATNDYWENGQRGIGFTLDTLRSADDIPTHQAGVKGAIDCREQTIHRWSMSDRGIVPDDWFEPLIATPTD